MRTLFTNWLTGYNPLVTTAPIWLNGFTPVSANLVEASVLANAGARPVDRDPVDARIIASVRNRTGQIIDSQNQVGGWPYLAQNTRPFVAPYSPNGDDDGDGYTNLEEVLQQMAHAVEQGPLS
jgi:hypothetical protein